MSLQNLEAMEKFQENGKKNEYLNKLKNLIAQIRNGDAIWADVLDLREQYGMPYMTLDTVRRSCGIYDEFNSAGWVSAPKNTTMGAKEVNSLNSDGSRTSEKLIELSEDEINSRESLLKAHGFNPVYFELVSAKTSKWQQGDGKGGLKNLYSSKITVKPIENGIDLEDICQHFEHFKSPVNNNLHRNIDRTGDKVAVLSLADVHFGRVASDYETGNVYNMDIAEQNMLKVANEFVNSLKGNNISEIHLLFGNDYLNSSFTGKTTSQSHTQDNNTTFNTIFKRGAEAIIKVIDILNTAAPIKVILVNGNHCRAEEFQMALLLEAYYRTVDAVTVDANPYPRKYDRIGNTLLGYTHGSDEKGRIDGLMQVEAAEDWGATKNHYWLLGHLHHLDVALKENFGVTTMVLPALTQMDKWTVTSGYTMAKAGSVAFIFDKENGMEDIKFFYV